ncbi:hypothetical protein FACS1894137_15490 [Spirochaetia bacterium]|nr:hypothetical protein FACS1894137_15490 [Spirochaetia bacterium]
MNEEQDQDNLYQDLHIKNKHFILHYGDLTDTSNIIRILQEVQADEIYNILVPLTSRPFPAILKL